jgi:hypothetical protein
MKFLQRYKHDLFTLLMFLLFLCVFDRGLFFTIRTWETRAYQKEEFGKIFSRKRDFNKHFLEIPKGTYNTLIMGSSRTHRGIHPYYLYQYLGQKAFKIARAKIRLKFNYYFYNQYKKYAGVPKVVIYGLDYFMFKLQSNPYFMKFVGEKGDEAGEYNNGPLLLLNNKNKIDSFLNDSLERLTENLNPEPVEPQAVKEIDPFIGYEKKKKLVKQPPAHYKRLKYVHYPGKEGIYFTKLLEQWQKDGVQVVLVFLPDYIGTYKSNFQQDLFKADIRQLTASYSNVTIYDYNRPDKFPLANPAYFLDGNYGRTNSHLSREGASLFNRLLCENLKHFYNDGS